MYLAAEALPSNELIWIPMDSTAVPLSSTFHSKRLIDIFSSPSTSSLVSVGIDGVAIWDVSCGLEGQSRLKPCPPRPCEGYHLPSHRQKWWTSLCFSETIFAEITESLFRISPSAFIYQTGGKPTAIQSAQNFSFFYVVYEQSESRWVALFQIPDANAWTLICDIHVTTPISAWISDGTCDTLINVTVYDLTSSSPSLQITSQHNVSGLFFYHAFFPYTFASCGDWLASFDCLIYVPNGGACVRRVQRLNWTDIGPIYSFSADCSVVAVKSSPRQFLSLSTDGTVAPLVEPSTAQGPYQQLDNSLATLCQFDNSYLMYWKVSADERFLAVACVKVRIPRGLLAVGTGTLALLSLPLGSVVASAPLRVLKFTLGQWMP